MAIFSCSWVLYVDSTFLTSRINAFYSVYLSAASQLNCGCLSAGPPSLGPHGLSDLWVFNSAIVWITILVTSATAFAIISLITAWSAILLCVWHILDFCDLWLDFTRSALYWVCRFQDYLFTPDTMQCYCTLYDDNTLCMFDYKFIACTIRSVCMYKCMHIYTSEHHLPLSSDWLVLVSMEDVLVMHLVSVCTTHYNRNIQIQRNPKDNINNRPTHRERKDNSDDYTRNWYQRVIRKPDRSTCS